ncbi:MAG: magnesium transporter [Bacteroidales bacterium]|jgi:magnesium transporter|nr:magnesium transporter [Bacteroidales bacterium]MDD2264830.1 magnesium transporter [Bacteroidales bacterium]MDD2832072.1 magnesium transporter [Bacteroidales bacterium]MDD3208734.1 magnesium transporter [Bacteroidales bacterium]MDD3697297.1 magnesium transporter [Bacteroidales bacterium]
MVTFSAGIRQLIENKDWKSLKYSLNEMDPIQAAEIIEETPEANDIILFRLLGRQLAKETFHLLSYEKQEQIIEGLARNVRKLSELLNDIEPDDRTAFFEELPGKICQRLIQFLSPEERNITIQLLGYPEDSIGRLMTPEYVAVKPNDTVQHAFEHIRMYGKDSETLNVIYIVDKQWKLIDDIRIKELILASPEQKISELMDSRFVALHVMDDQETAVKTFQDYDRVALPVVNNEGILLGIVTIDDIMDVVEEETTEDFHKFGSFQQSISNPLKERVLQLYKNRIVWLFALVFMNIFSGAAISSFESIIQSVVSLVFFLPLLIDSGGNAGSQSATLMIRALATGDVKLSDWYKLIGKELIVSFMLGVTMAAGVAVIASFRAPEIIAVVAISMVLIVISGSLIGMLLPFVFTKLKLDPATASAPLITSISDIFGVLIYFSVAVRFMG